MKKVRWGIIGCGNVTEVKSGPGFQKADHSELVAVMRRNGALAKDYARRHRVAKWYDNAQSLIEDADVDAVYIATPPDVHLKYAKAVARVAKAVYVEKPMARSYAEAQELVAVCQQANVPLFVAHYRRALPRFLKLKKILQADSIGAVQIVNMVYHKQPAEVDLEGKENWRVRPEIAGCGYFCDLAPHMLDILQFLVGEIKQASGQTANFGKRYPAEDSVTGQFTFANGAQGTGIWNFNSGAYLDRTELTGAKGKLTFSIFGSSPIVLESASGIESFSIENPPHIQQPLIQTIVNQLLGIGVCPSTGQNALHTSWVMDKLINRK